MITVSPPWSLCPGTRANDSHKANLDSPRRVRSQGSHNDQTILSDPSSPLPNRSPVDLRWISSLNTPFFRRSLSAAHKSIRGAKAILQAIRGQYNALLLLHKGMMTEMQAMLYELHRPFGERLMSGNISEYPHKTLGQWSKKHLHMSDPQSTTVPPSLERYPANHFALP